MSTPLVHIDAGTFQKQLISVAETVAQKIKREAPALLPGVPHFASFNLHVLMRQAMHTYDLLFFLNADERREKDCQWRAAYSIVALPLVRNMIDCLYNITSILESPTQNGRWFLVSGFKKMLEAIDQDETRYRGRPDWDAWIDKARNGLELEIRKQGLSMTEIQSQPAWPTLGQYIRPRAGGILTAHQAFLKTFVHGPWREYSAMAHGGAEGLARVAVYYISDSLEHEQRDKLDEYFPRLLFMHLTRAAATLLCIVTELQAYFRFEGAKINERIRQVWEALRPAFEVKELYDERYGQLMRDRGVIP